MEELKNPIENAIDSIEGSHPDSSKELFLASHDDVELKTDLKEPENICIVKLRAIDRFLEDIEIPSLYEDIIIDFMFVNISLDRQSRKEFVDSITRTMNNFQVPGEFDKIGDSRK